MGRNYYELLGVSEDVSVDEIRAAYRAAMLKNHPDLHEGGGADKNSRNLNLAYETLSSAVRRAQYDDRLRRHRTRQSERRNAEPSNPDSQSSTPANDTDLASLFHRNRLVFVSSVAGLLLFFGWVLLLLVDPFSFFVVETASQPTAESPSEVDSFDSDNNGANKKAGKQTAKAPIQAETTEITPTVPADDLPKSSTLPEEESEDSTLTVNGQETERRPSESIAATENSGDVDSAESVTDGMEKAPGSLSNKQPIPNNVDIAAAEEKIRLVFRDRYDSGNSREQNINLAQELLEVGMETNDDIAARYVLYQSASRIAVSTAAAPLYRRIVGALANEFEIEDIDLLMAGYAAMMESPDAASKTSELLSVIAKDIIRYRALDRLSNAKSLCDVGLNIARDTPDEQDLMALSDFIIWQMGKKTESANALSTVASLSNTQSAPETAGADLFVAGRYRCFSQGNWRVGLPLLANGSEQTLSNLARLEITEGESAASKIGNAWWDFSNKDGLSVYERAQIQHHASEWLKLAVDDLSGLDKMLAEKRLRDSVANTDEISSYVKLAIEFDGAQRPAIGVVQSPPLPAVAPFNSAKANEHQEAWAKYLGVEVEVENSIGMKLRVIPAGAFTMGEGDDAHEVTLTKPFMLGTYEVTQAQYERVMGVNPSRRFKGAKYPVECVTWNDAAEFCRKLSGLPAEQAAGRVYHLPTAAQWDHACRSGARTKYYFGDDATKLVDYAWIQENNNNEGPSPVGTKRPNAWGLHDMYGNVYEWCNDWAGENLTTATTDPTGAEKGSRRVERGGGWNSFANHVQIPMAAPPSSRTITIGLRVACLVLESKSTRGNHAAMDTKSDRSTKLLATPPAASNTAPAPANAPFDAAKAKEHQEAWAKYLGVEVETENSIGMKFRVVPPGSFTMGPSMDIVSFDQKSGQYMEKRTNDAHEVMLTKAFELGVFEVTQEQFSRVMHVNPSHFKGDDNPVERITWRDAVEFCDKLSKLPNEQDSGYVYRLPTEAEWEYACRSGTSGPNSFTPASVKIGSYAWFKDNSNGATHPVGSKFPNSFGLYDMYGNVFEWCSDWKENYPSGLSSAIRDPAGATSGQYRILRGGFWNSHYTECSSNDRYWYSPGRLTSMHKLFGFRIVRERIK